MDFRVWKLLRTAVVVMVDIVKNDGWALVSEIRW